MVFDAHGPGNVVNWEVGPSSEVFGLAFEEIGVAAVLGKEPLGVRVWVGQLGFVGFRFLVAVLGVWVLCGSAFGVWCWSSEARGEEDIRGGTARSDSVHELRCCGH